MSPSANLRKYVANIDASKTHIHLELYLEREREAGRRGSGYQATGQLNSAAAPLTSSHLVSFFSSSVGSSFLLTLVCFDSLTAGWLIVGCIASVGQQGPPELVAKKLISTDFH